MGLKSRSEDISGEFFRSIICSEKVLRSNRIPASNQTISAFNLLCLNITSTPENNVFTKIWNYDYTSAGIIVGIIFAAIFGLALLTAITCCFIKKKNQRGRVVQPAQRGNEWLGPVTSNIFIVPSGAPPPAYSSQGYAQPYSPYAGYTLAPSAPGAPAYHPGAAPMPPAYSQAALPPPAYSYDPAYPPQGAYPPGPSGAQGGAYPPQGNIGGK